VTSLYPESVRGRNNLGTELMWQSKSRGCVACAAEAERLFESLIQRDATDTIERIFSTDTNIGARDMIDGGTESDILVGGAADDSIQGGEADDTLFGDNATLVEADGSAEANDIYSTAPDHGGPDTLSGGPGNDLLIAGSGVDTNGVSEDTLHGNEGNDTLFGDNALIQRNAAYRIQQLRSTHPSSGGDDQLFGDDGDDVAVGGPGQDALHGGDDQGNDILLGDNGELLYDQDADLSTLDIFQTTETDHGANDAFDGDDGSNHVLGGPGFDTMTMVWHTTDDFVTTYNIGSKLGTGDINATDGTTTHDVTFIELEYMLDTVPADTLILNGTPDDDTFDYTAGTDDTTAR